jgi:hypothetical protein
VAVRPGEDIHNDVSIYGGLGIRAFGRALNPLVAEAAHFISQMFHSLRRAEPAAGADVKALEGHVSVRVVIERGVREFGQVHTPLQTIRCLQEIPTINQYRYSLHVSRSSEIVWIAIAGMDVSFCCSVTQVAYPIANPAFIVFDRCLKVAHFVSVRGVRTRKRRTENAVRSDEFTIRLDIGCQVM